MDENEQGAASLQEVLAELTERGRLEWDAAVARVENRKLREEIVKLRNERNAHGPTGDPSSNGVPPAGEPAPVAS